MPADQEEFSSGNDINAATGSLYVVATPIGNLEDVSIRCGRILAEVDLILAEDTRQTGKLLQHLGVDTKCISYHQHNENQQAERYIEQLVYGKTIALVSDAGTPLISDPGFSLVRAAHQKNIKVIPIPGACAVVTALSAAGLPVSRFTFEGFLPAKKGARQQTLQALLHEPRTMVFYESTHRIQASLADMQQVFGGDREAVIARELTKMFEQIQSGTLAELEQWLAESTNHLKGEFVVIVTGVQTGVVDDTEMHKLIELLLPHMGVKQAAKVAAEFSGGAKNKMYEIALAIKAED